MCVLSLALYAMVACAFIVGEMFIFFGVAGFLWIVITIGMWMMPEVRACAGTHVSREKSESLVRTWCRSEATVVMWIRCYHNRTSTHRNSDGSTSTRTEKVYTHSASQPVSFDAQEDVSAPFTAPNQSTLMTIGTGLCYSDFVSGACMEAQYCHFLSHNTRDTHQEKGVRVDLPGFKHAFLVTPGGGMKCKTVPLYVFSTIIGILPFVHMALSSAVDRQQFTVTKKLSIIPAGSYAAQPLAPAPSPEEPWALPYAVYEPSAPPMPVEQQPGSYV
eukprot:TRINITY_DN4865_c2_g3_i2.p1 TRINITY_DN4865_c2_g3~~TRINITY_DN4865_c2_g3_i2.p1  ORF type:complete len:274 (+),score=67.08 TRINITY_DN4865_c2_g3_i2:66-887(+)